MKNLTTLSKQINEFHALAINSAKTAIEHAHKAGKLLIEAKQNVNHGEWESWVENNCPFSMRTAQKYMRLAKTPLTADLGIEAALENMAEPREAKAPEKVYLDLEPGQIYLKFSDDYLYAIARHPEEPDAFYISVLHWESGTLEFLGRALREVDFFEFIDRHYYLDRKSFEEVKKDEGNTTANQLFPDVLPLRIAA